MFRAHVLNIRWSKLHYTASGIITPIGVMIPEPFNILGAIRVTRSKFHAENPQILISYHRTQFSRLGDVAPRYIATFPMDFCPFTESRKYNKLILPLITPGSPRNPFQQIIQESSYHRRHTARGTDDLVL